MVPRTAKLAESFRIPRASCGLGDRLRTLTLLLQNGRSDTLVPEADAEALHQAAPEPRTIRWYVAGHGLDSQALLDRLDWLHAEIGLDPRQ